MIIRSCKVSSRPSYDRVPSFALGETTGVQKPPAETQYDRIPLFGLRRTGEAEDGRALGMFGLCRKVEAEDDRVLNISISLSSL